MKKVSINENLQLHKEEVQCNCFSYHYPEKEYFLAKNRKHHKQRQKNNQHNQSSTDSLQIPKNKRSLKKARQPALLSPQPKKEHDVYREYYSPGKISGKDDFKVSHWGQVRQVEYKAPVPKVTFNRIGDYVSQTEGNLISTKIRSNRRQDKQLAFREIRASPLFYSPQHQNSIHQHVAPKISFRIQSSQPQIAAPSEQIRTTNPRLSASGIKDSSLTEPQTCQKLESQPQIQSTVQSKLPKATRVVKSRTKDDQIQQEKNQNQRKFNFKETSQSLVNRNSLVVPNGRQSGIGKSKVTLKKGKEGKNTIKKMSDVQQIRSMVDSEEQMEDLKESVVLGRLRQYGNFTGGSESILPMTIESKMGFESRLGYQSTTAGGKSHLRTFESVFR